MHILELVFGNKWRSIIIWFLIERKKPCIVHYHEMQHGGYLLNRISDKIRSLGDAKPQIIGSSWGSDLSFFGYIDSHSGEIQKLLDLTSVLTAERSEEFEVLRRYNYSGTFLAPIYNSVGSQPEKNFFGPVSGLRNVILIKGYQHDQGRALNVLKALESLEEAKKFKIRVFSAAKSSPVDLQSSRMKSLFGFDIEVIPRQSHAEFLKIFSESRIYIGLSESDGLSTSMVEAMATGCFPIQSSNSAAPQFIEHGVTGFVVDPWDIPSIRDSIRIALTDDKILEAAQIVNRNVITEKYNWNSGVKNVAKLYSLNSDSKDGIPGGLF
jgi:glycosyltransferase involved in cell wall biosynthesis